MTATANIVTEVKLLVLWWWSVLRAIIGSQSDNLKSTECSAALDLVDYKLSVDSPHGLVEHDVENDISSNAYSGCAEIVKKAKVLSLAIRVPGIIKTSASYPLSARTNLRSIIGFDIGRLTPVPAENAHFAYKVQDTDSDAKSVTVDISVIEKGQLDAANRIAENLGCKLTYLGADPIERNAVNLILDSATGLGAAKGSRFYLALATLLFCSAATPFIQKQVHLITLTNALAPIEAKARKNTAELNQIEERLRWVGALQSDAPIVLDILDNLTSSFADRDIISYLVWDEPHLEIVGTSENPGELVRKFASIKGIASIEYLEPIQTTDERELSGFHLRLTFVSETSSGQGDG